MCCVFLWMFFLGNLRKIVFSKFIVAKIQLYFNAEAKASCYFPHSKMYSKFIFVFFYYFALIWRKSLQQFHFILQYFIFSFDTGENFLFSSFYCCFVNTFFFKYFFGCCCCLLLFWKILKIIYVFLYLFFYFHIRHTHESSLHNRY